MVNGKFIFIQHLPLSTYHYFQSFSKTNSEKYGADHFAFFCQEFKFFIVAIKYDVGHFWPQ